MASETQSLLCGRWFSGYLNTRGILVPRIRASWPGGRADKELKEGASSRASIRMKAEV